MNEKFIIKELLFVLSILGIVGTKYRIHDRIRFILREFLMRELDIILIQLSGFIISDPDCISLFSLLCFLC